jgi:hypothetical protein
LFYKIKVLLNVYLVVNQIIKNLAFWMLVFSYGSSLTIVTKCNQNLGHVFFLVTQLLKMHINAWPLRILTFIFQNMLYLMKLSFLSLSLLLCHLLQFQVRFHLTSPYQQFHLLDKHLPCIYLWWLLLLLLIHQATTHQF